MYCNHYLISFQYSIFIGRFNRALSSLGGRTCVLCALSSIRLNLLIRIKMFCLFDFISVLPVTVLVRYTCQQIIDILPFNRKTHYIIWFFCITNEIANDNDDEFFYGTSTTSIFSRKRDHVNVSTVFFF